jgi:hypothetical protein
VLVGGFALVAILSLLYGYSLGSREQTEAAADDVIDLPATEAPTDTVVTASPFPESTTSFVGAAPGHVVPAGAVEYLNRNVVRSVAVDPEGFVWTAGPGGVVQWNPRTGLPVLHTLPDGTGPLGAVDIAVGDDGDVWVTTERGISHWDGDTWLADAVPAPAEAGTRMDGVAVAPDGSVWAASNQWPTTSDGRGLFRLHRADETFEGRVDSFNVANSVQQFIVAGDALWAVIGDEAWRYAGGTWSKEIDVGGRWINGLSFEPDGSAWIATTDLGVRRWEGGPLIDVGAGRDVLIPDSIDGDVMSVVVDDDLIPWALVYGNDGLGSVTQELVRLDDFTRYALPIQAACCGGGAVAAVDGTVWIGTLDGLVGFDGTAWSILRIADELAVAFAGSMAVDADGVVWLADGTSVVRWNGRSARVMTRGALGWPEMPDMSFAGTWVEAAPGGPVWAGVGCRVSMSGDGGWRPVTPPDGLDGRFCWPFGRGAGADGSLWLLSDPGSGARLDRYDGEAWDSAPLPEHDVWTIAVASDGTLWAGGTAVSHLEDGVWVTQLEGVNVTTIEVAGDGSVWAAEECWDCPGGGGGVWHLADGVWAREGVYIAPAMAMAADGSGWAIVRGADGNAGLWRNAGSGAGFRPVVAQAFTTLALDPDGGVWAASDGRLLHVTP